MDNGITWDGEVTITWDDGTTCKGTLGHVTVQYDLVDGVARNLKAVEPTIPDLLEDFKARVERDDLPTT